MEPPPQSQRLRWQFPEIEDIRLQPRGRPLSVLIILFFVIVFATLLFLYACWIRRRSLLITARSSSSHDPPGGGRRRRSQLPPSRGLGLAAINGIPVILAGHDDGSVLKCTECCICLGGFEDGEKLKVLPRCRHAFHSECLDRWLRSESSCPLCRASLRDESNSESIKIVVTE